MGTLTTAFWTAGPSGAWAAKLGSTAVGGGGSALGGINCKARRSSIQARTWSAMLSMTASDTGGVGSGRADPDAAMLDARPHFAFCIAWATPAEALRFGGICTEQINGSILTPLWDQGQPLSTQTTGAMFKRTHLFITLFLQFTSLIWPHCHAVLFPW